MRKFFALLICFLYLISSNVCYAFSELYYLRNTSPSTVNTHLQNVLFAKNYTIQKQDPIYAISNKTPQTYIIMALEQYGNSLLYYYESNNDKKLNKSVLKMFDAANIIYEKSFNEVTMNRFSEIAQRSISGQKRTYSFEEPKTAPQQTSQVEQQQQQQVQQAQQTQIFTPPTTLKGAVVKVGKGTALPVYLQNPIDTSTAAVGDQVIGVLQNDWVINNSHVVAGQGSVLYGVLTKAEHAKMGMRNGYVQIDFNRLETPEGQTYNITTEKIDFEVTNDGRLKQTVTNVAGAAAVGALVGLMFALLGNGNYGSAAAIGAGVSGGVALATQVAQQGVDAEIPSYTELEVILGNDINVVVY